MLFPLIKFTIALIFLIVSADMIVRSAVKIAHYFNVSKLIVGILVIGFGTSLPELVAGIQAARLDLTPIVLGNVIGSNIVNIIFVLGLTALISPIVCDKKYAKRDGIVLLIATLLFVFIGLQFKILSLYWAIIFVILFISYIIFVLKTHPREEIEAEVDEVASNHVSRNKMLLYCGVLVVFLCLLGASADVMINEAVTIAKLFGVSEAVIGLTVIAMGTSLPELATCGVAAFRRHSEIAYGNIMGSNIYNILCIPGIAALVKPLQFEGLSMSLWVLLASTLLFLGIAIFKGRFTRMMGASFICFYFLYLYFILS